MADGTFEMKLRVLAATWQTAAARLGASNDRGDAQEQGAFDTCASQLLTLLEAEPAKEQTWQLRVAPPDAALVELVCATASYTLLTTNVEREGRSVLPSTKAAARERIRRALEVLRPTGECLCGGAGLCSWCQSHG